MNNPQRMAIAALESIHGKPHYQLSHKSHGSKTELLVFNNGICGFAYTVSQSGTLELFVVGG